MPDDPRLDTPDDEPLEEAIPDQPPASPSRHNENSVENPADVPWWTPSWQDSAKHLGWRWIFAAPAAAIILLAIAAVTVRGVFLLPLLFAGIKFVLIALALPFVLLLEMWRKAIQSRKEPFCIHCGYGLTGLPDHHTCPECGRPYTFATINEYRRDPHWFKQRYKMIGHLPEPDAPFRAGTGKTSHDGT